jgi:membrane protease YdiL (CAAX protease family)
MNAKPGKLQEIRNLSLIGLVIVVYLLQQGMLWLRQAIEPQGAAFKWMVMANQLLSILLPVIAFVLIFRLPRRQALGLAEPPLVKTVVAVILGIILIYAINSVLPKIIPPTPTYTNMSNSIVAYDSVWGLLLTIFTISVAAPLADELFFRGILLQTWRAKYGKLAAVVAVGVLTALFHSLEPFKLTHSFIMSTLFASSVLWTGSVWTSIMLHGLHNALSLVGG